MGQTLGNLSNAKNIQEANPSDLSGSEKAQRGMLGGLAGGLSQLGKQQQQPQGGGAVSFNTPPPPQFDFSQLIQKKPQQAQNAFYGGY